MSNINQLFRGAFIVTDQSLIPAIDSMRDNVEKAVNSFCEHNIEALDRLHKHVPLEELNRLRMKLYDDINSSCKELVDSIALEYLEKLIGPDIMVQNKLNISIQMPMDESSVLSAHGDDWAGDSFYQVNLWIPLTCAFESNSMFVFDECRSIEFRRLLATTEPDRIDLFYNSQIKDVDFVSIDYGQFLIFHPSLIHGNVLNKTNKTRVSVNLRFKALFSPSNGSSASSRGLGPYYRVLRATDWTQLSTKLYRAGNP